MNKSRVVQWQLIVLAGVVALLVFRSFFGLGTQGGEIELTDLETHHQYHRYFEVSEPVTIEIEAFGSFEYEDLEKPLAANAWIWDIKERKPVWQLAESDQVKRIRTFGAETLEELTLEPGLYAAGFAAYGNEGAHTETHAHGATATLRRIFNGIPWEKVRKHWKLILRIIDGKEHAITVVSQDQIAATDRLIWSSGPFRNRSEEKYLFQVNEPTRLNIYGVGEFSGDEALDHGWIEEAQTGRVIWEMTPQNTQPAGGALINKYRFDQVSFEPGVYRAQYRTNEQHASGSWMSNPPFDPAGWGLAISVDELSDRAQVSTFDPWNQQRPIVNLTSVGDDEAHAVSFQLDQATRVLVHAVGELTHDNRYDYGWIEQNNVDRVQNRPLEADELHPDADYVIWEMKYEDSNHAGGDADNRETIALLDLQAGTYSVFYKSDDSHSFGDWNRSAPTHGERWGISLFPLGEGTVAGELVILAESSSLNRERQEPGGLVPRAPASVGEAPVAFEDPAQLENIIVQLTEVGNNENLEQTFVLTEPTRVRILALGELSRRGNRYDYGYIESSDSGNIVWDMVWENSAPAGGDPNNRFVDTYLQLEAGEYVAHFRTDGTHAYPDFDTPLPTNAAAWGITIALDK